MTKRALTLLAGILLVTGISGCAGTGTHSGTASVHTAPAHDRDNDGDENNDDARALDYGHAARPAERRAITTLLVHYYAAAAADNGVKACKLLMPFVAESLPETYGHNAGTEGKSCPVVLAKMFKQRHQLLTRESATLKVYAMRVGEGRALTVLSFSFLPEVRVIFARRDGASWKVLNILDGIME